MFTKQTYLDMLIICSPGNLVVYLIKWGIFVITGFRLQSPAGGAPSRSQQMRFVVPVNNTKIGYEPILI